MKVLHLDTGREVRGGQRQLMTLAAGLGRRGVEQTVVCNASEGIRTDQTLAITSPAGGTRLWKQARDVDLIHAHDSRSHTLALIWAPATPLVVARRVAFPPARGVLSRWKYSRPAAYIAVSRHVCRVLVSAGVASERIVVVHDGVWVPSEEPSFRPLRTALKVGVIETDDPLKLPDLARDAIKRAGMELCLCRDLRRDLPDVDVLLYLSESEGLGSAILAAGAQKTPVIASNIGGIPEIVDHERTGLLCENEIGSIAAALTRYAREPELAASCAEEAYAQVLERFSDDMIVERTLEVYRSVLASVR